MTVGATSRIKITPMACLRLCQLSVMEFFKKIIRALSQRIDRVRTSLDRTTIPRTTQSLLLTLNMSLPVRGKNFGSIECNFILHDHLKQHVNWW